MIQRIVLTDSREISQPRLHDAQLNGLLLSDGKLFVPVETGNGATLCLVLHGVERLRADDYRQGNTILDVTVSVGSEIEMADVAYAYGLEPADSAFLRQTLTRLVSERRTVVRVNPSYGCTLACICESVQIEDDWAWKV